MNILLRLVSVTAIAAVSSTATAQTIGIEGGIAHVSQNGSIESPCNCDLTNGAGTGWNARILFEKMMMSGFRGGLKAGIMSKSISNTDGVHNELAIVQDGPSGDTATVTLPIQYDESLTLTYLAFAPYLSYHLPNIGLFFAAGPDFGFILSSYYKANRQLMASSVTLSNGHTISNIKLSNGSTSEPLDPRSNGQVVGLRTLTVSLEFSGGFEFELLNAAIAPTITYDLPMTNPSAGNWNVSSFLGSLAIKFALN